MLRRFFSYYQPYKGLFLLDFGCAIVSGLLELGFPMAVKLFVDRLLLSQEWLLIILASAGLLVIYVLNTGLMAVVTYWGHMLGINIETDMRRAAFNHLQKLSFGYFDNQKTGHIVGRLTKDLEEIGEVAHHGPEDLFIALMTFIGALLLMFSVNWQMAVITATIVPVTAWATSHFGGRMTENFHRLFSRIGEFNARIEENVGGMRVVQAFANEGHERALFEKDNQSYRRVKLEAYKLMAATSSMSYLSMRLTQMVVMVTGAYFVLAGELTAGGFIGFLLLVGIFFRPVEKINSVIETYPKGIAGFRRFTELIDTEPDIADAPDAVAVDHLKGEIAYRSVTFGYTAAKTVFEEINLDIRAGETIAFVGPSGAGKTTICSLLPRFYEVVSGSITIDGIDIRQMTKESLRQQIGIVQQDVFLFGGTLRENIAYGRLGASEADIVEAAHRARLEDMLANLPDGLDTVIGERGVKLSGGQKQRVAIARMFLKNPPILILDEATSALDTETERAIQRSLAELSQGRTTLIIAHRLATIQGADRIVVIDESGIAEQGTHQDLIERRGAYNRLHSGQVGMV
ncbi:multidrug ABC transporter ATP-binding protein [Rhizobium sp. Leaf321]|uniref:ABC transporter ATP-binding protein n=1 Tax=Rhizobium sp. Leaf321 TaxID=1736335 RepID=UPI000714A010|nr:ABC transporter ATP-binding protein [Rhizobium sp. Leaf321]KQQ79278.1 multidrug ABC transporter ATP-binding protein [Rhizobium sp. Leaf321]